MKKIFVSAFVASIAFLTTTASFAKDVTEGENKPVMIDGGNFAISFIAGDVVSTKGIWSPLCPEGTPGEVHCLGMTRETIVRVKFTLNGCLDMLGPVSFKAIRDNNETNIVAISVAATQIKSKSSILTRCVAAPTAFADVIVSGEHLDLEAAKNLIHFVGVKQ